MDVTMKLLVLAPLVIASTAYAQAPGDYYGGDGGGYDGGGAPGMSPEVAPVPQPPPPPRIRRFSIGLGIGHASLAPHSAPDAKTEFDVGQLAIRYLFRRHLELELAFTGGSETLDDGSEGSKELSQAVLSLRWRFSPQRRWNWWLMAGMGSLAVTNVYATDEERDAAMQSTLQFGIGLERRWTRFAIQAEMRAVGVAKNEDMGDQPVQVDVPTNSMEPYPYPPYTSPADTGGKKGGQFAITANYYF
jgi:hypothetical protein